MTDGVIHAETPQDGVVADLGTLGREPHTEESHPDRMRRDGSRRWVDSTGLAEGGLLLDVAVIIDLASIYLPLLGPVLAPAVPAPFALLYLRRGPRVSILAAIVAGFLVTVLSGPHFGWRMSLEAIIGIVMGAAMKRRTPSLLVWFLGTFILATAGFCASLALIVLTGVPIQDIPIGLRNGMVSGASFIATVATFGGFSEQWLQIRPVIADVARFALRFWPLVYYVYILVFSLPTTALYYAVSNAAVRVLGYDVPPFPARWVGSLVRIVLLPLRPFAWLFGLRHRRRAAREAAEYLREGEAA